MPDGRLPELELEVSCGGAVHRIGWTARGLELFGHPGGRDEDDVLVALSGEPAVCRRIEAAWASLEPERALELLAAGGAEGLAAIARRQPVAREERERVRRRDDLSDDERARAMHGFDQMIALAEVAAMGPAWARVRAVEAVDELWRRRSDRRRSRRALASAAARAAGAGTANVLLLPTRKGPGLVVRVRGRAVGVVSRRWLTAA